MSTVFRLSVGVLVLAALAASAQATSVVTSSVTFFSPTELGNPRAATATFETVVNSNNGNLKGKGKGNSPSSPAPAPYLRITLTNTSLFDVADPTQVLMSLYFDLPNNVTLSGGSAALPTGSQVLFDPTFTGTNLSGVWAYNSNLVWPIDPVTGLPRPPLGFLSNYGGQSDGLSACGLGLFGPPDILDPTAPHPGEETPPDGPPYGLLSAGYSGGGNAAVTGQFPLDKDSVVFCFSVIPADFVASTDTITNVVFGYATSLGGSDFFGPPVPEPVTLAGLALALGSLAGYVRRRAKK